MVEFAGNCTATLDGVWSTCMPVHDGAFDTKYLVSGLKTGECQKSLSNLFVQCTQESFQAVFEKSRECYTSAEDFYNCLPGIHSNRTHHPTTCENLSYLVFFSNEATTFLEGKLKLVTLLVTQIFRLAERQYCFLSCEEAPIEPYSLMGSREWRHEAVRYTIESFYTLLKSALCLFGDPASGYCILATDLFRSKKVAYLTQMIQALPQQGARNADFLSQIDRCQNKTQFNTNLKSLTASKSLNEEKASEHLDKPLLALEEPLENQEINSAQINPEDLEAKDEGDLQVQSDRESTQSWALEFFENSTSYLGKGLYTATSSILEFTKEVSLNFLGALLEYSPSIISQVASFVAHMSLDVIMYLGERLEWLFMKTLDGISWTARFLGNKTIDYFNPQTIEKESFKKISLQNEEILSKLDEHMEETEINRRKAEVAKQVSAHKASISELELLSAEEIAHIKAEAKKLGREGLEQIGLDSDSAEKFAEIGAETSSLFS